MDGFIFFLIFIFVILPIMKNIFGSRKASRKLPNSKQRRSAKPSSWEQGLKSLKLELEGLTNNPGANNGTDNGHAETRYQTHQRTHKQDKDQYQYSKQRAERRRAAHKRLASVRASALQNRGQNKNIMRTGNKGRDDWGARGDKRGGGLLFLLLFGIIVLFVISNAAPDLWHEIMRIFFK